MVILMVLSRFAEKLTRVDCAVPERVMNADAPAEQS